MLALAACGDSDPAPGDADTPTPDAARDSGADVGADTGTDTGVDGDSGEPDGGAARSELLLNADGSNERYAGIGRANAGASCTAVLIDVGGGDDAPAYALASGHCTGWWAHTVAFEDRAVDAPGEVIFRFFTDTVEAHRRVPVAAAAYSSMMGTDLAILRLDATVGALRDEGIEGLAIADTLPTAGASIVNVGAPLSTTADPDEHLRLGRCTLGTRTRLVEFEWLWNDNVVHDCPDIRVGSSGSPLLDTSDAIVAIVHTTTSEQPHAQCHLGRPCELRAEGIASPDVTSYAIPVVGLGACFAEGVLDLARAGCPLVRSTGLVTEREGFRYVAPAPDATVRIALFGEVGLTHARAKWGPAVTTDCRSADGWNAPFAIDETPVLEAPLPESDELFVVCLRAGTASEIQPPERAIAWLVAVDGTPPALPLPVRHTVDGTSATFTVIVENPTYASYRQKSGPEASTDCDDPEGYQFVNVRFGRFTVTLSDAPTKICVVAEDFANNRSEPMEWVLTAR